MSDNPPTLLEQATNPTPPTQENENNEDEPLETRIVETGGSIATTRTHIGGRDVELDDPLTKPSFEDDHGLLSGEYGRPRPREFWTAKQLGRTPPMELLKNAVSRQLTGGELIATVDEGELVGPQRAFADIVIDIYQGPHYQNKSFDNLTVDAISDMLDFGFAYWSFIPSSDGEFPVAGFKPEPPLSIQHNLDPETGDFVEDPAYYSVPFKRSGSTISVTASEPDALALDQVVSMRDPLATESDTTYGQSLATKVREWLELIIDVDVHQKRFYSDSQLPSGLLHFMGNLDSDELTEVEQDLAEASGDPHDLVTASSEGQASWVPMGGKVTDLEAIQEQQWYYKLVYAAAGLNLNELGVIEGSGFAKETPALQKAVYKNVTKPVMNAIFDPQNNHVIPIMAEAAGIGEVEFRLSIERFDPVQEQFEREEAQSVWGSGALSLNEYRGGLGREAEEFVVEMGETELDLADTPRYIVDTLRALESPGLEVSGESVGEASMGSHSEPGPPDFEQDPVLSEEEAFEELGRSYSPQAIRQLSDTIEVQSSFIATVAYSENTDFLQLEFEREDGSTSVYWYGSVPRYRFFNLIRADSKGKYFNKYIRGEYFYARLS